MSSGLPAKDDLSTMPLMGDIYPKSQMAERLRLRLERRLRRAGTNQVNLRDLCYSRPMCNEIALSTPTRQVVGYAQITRSLGRDGLIKYCLALLHDGTNFESWISRDEPSVARLAIDGCHVGRCEPSPVRQTSISRPGLWNFYKGLIGFGRMWRAKRYDLWSGQEPYGCVHRPFVVGDDSIKIQHVSGQVLPVNMLSYTSWLRGKSRPNRIIPQDAPSLKDPREEQLYLAASIMFKMLIFEHDLSD